MSKFFATSTNRKSFKYFSGNNDPFKGDPVQKARRKVSVEKHEVVVGPVPEQKPQMLKKNLYFVRPSTMDQEPY